jgi:molybdopterin molybdotransferase
MKMQVDDCARPDLWSIETAFAAIVSAGTVGGHETVLLSRAAGRVTARGVLTRTALPRFDQSAMDGYGLHPDDLHRTGPIGLAGLVRAGGISSTVLRPGEAVRLMTGAAIPSGVAAVVMEEKVDRIGGSITLRSPVEPGQNIRRRGEDVGEGTTIVHAGQQLDARHIALLAASGHADVEVVRRVRIGVLSTGDELVDPGSSASVTTVFDSNRPMVQALLSSPATHVEDLGCVRDDPDAYAALLSDIHPDYDLVVTSGGVSGSDADHSVSAVRRAGGTSTRISLAVKPGKPFAFGTLGSCRVISLLGNPVAAMVGTLLFARPLAARLSGRTASLPDGLVAVTASTFHHRSGRTEFVPAAVVGRTRDGRLTVEKLGKGGSARLAPLVAADGLAVVPAGSADIAAGEPVVFHPFSTPFGL